MTHVICAKLVEGFGYFDLLGRVKVGICKLFSFSQGALNDLEARNIGEKVANGLVWISIVGMRVLSRMNARETWVSFAKVSS